MKTATSTILKRSVPLLIATILCAVTGIGHAQSISMGSLNGSQYCPGDPIAASFAVTGYFLHKNVFTLQLSDPAGGFKSGFTNLASLKDTLPGTFTITTAIPAGAAVSTHYRVRIIATNPYLTSADNGSDLSIGMKRATNVLTPGVAVAGASIQVTASSGSSLDSLVTPGDSLSWDFGDGASPATASGRADSVGTVSVTYLTPGIKHITVREYFLPGGCSATGLATVRVYDCTMPSIPKDAIVISNDGSASQVRNTIWINPGVTVEFTGAYDTVFAEPGSTITSTGVSNVIYLKSGVSFSGGLYDIIIHSDSASVQGGFRGLDITCPAMDFDYTNAPPNSIMRPLGGVSSVAQTSSIRVTPNPAAGFATLRGIPAMVTRIIVENVLGAPVMELENRDGSDITLDLSRLAAGTYHVRMIGVAGFVASKTLLHIP